jgi:hypothetical protein
LDQRWPENYAQPSFEQRGNACSYKIVWKNKGLQILRPVTEVPVIIRPGVI